MIRPSPAIKSFLEFTNKLGDALRRIYDWEKKKPDTLALLNVRRQLEATGNWTAGGKRPNEQQLRRLNFGWVAAREIEPFDQQLSSDLSELNQYMRHWPPGVVAPGWP